MNRRDLAYTVILAGGNTAQTALFEFLLLSTFNPNLELKDYRIGHSMISLFPPQYHAYMALIFWQEEYNQGLNLLKSDSTVKLYSPWEVLKLHSQLNLIPYGTFLIPYLTKAAPASTLELQALTNISYPGDIGSTTDTYETKLLNLLGETQLSNFLLETIAENNKVKTAHTLAKWLGYQNTSVNNIARFFEQCQFNPLLIAS